MNNSVIIFGVIALIVTISAYSFDNPDYNQLLGDDLEELYSDSYFSNSRSKRDTSDAEEKCRKHRPKLCCGKELFHHHGDDNKEIRALCFNEITGKDKPEMPPLGKPFEPFNCEKMEQRRKEMMCIIQCIGQKKNIVDNDGRIKPAEFGKQVKEKLAEVKYLDPVVDKIIEGCLADIKNMTRSDGKCRPDAIIADFCLFKNIQLNCPADQIKDKEACEKMQERLKQPGHPGHRFEGHPGLRPRH